MSRLKSKFRGITLILKAMQYRALNNGEIDFNILGVRVRYFG